MLSTGLACLLVAGVTVIGLGSILGADNVPGGGDHSPAPAPSDGVQFF